MTSEARATGSVTRGFLFADLRDYTAYIESRGDDAGAELLRVYRELVREAVSRHEGAEIRTEGDSFYVVFPSASSAVRCGLDIVESAVASRPVVRVGIGVHAGESTETDEGYVGSVVNIAARICAQARAGEVLVSDIVRGLVRTRGRLRFAPRGTRRLKGIRDPIELFAVHSAEDASGVEAPQPLVARARRFVASRLAVAAVAVLSVVLVSGAAIVAQAALNEVGRAEASSPPSGLGDDPASSLAADTQVPAATRSSAVSPQLEEGDSREDAASRLRQQIDPNVARLCVSADPQDAPRVFEGALDPSDPIIGPLPTRGGLRCELGGGDAPDVLFYWRAASATPSIGISMGTSDAFFYIVGQRNLRTGDCAVETRAWGTWEFGAQTGNVLCSEFGGQTLLAWTYDDQPIIGLAERDDGDMQRLYRWWEDHARLLGPEANS